VDAVKEVLEITEESIEPAPSIGNKYSADFIQGMWKKDENFIMLLNVNNVFARDELSIIQESSEEPTELAEAEAEA
jgi:purine-binding chemotaxis protein CheW